MLTILNKHLKPKLAEMINNNLEANGRCVVTVGIDWSELIEDINTNVANVVAYTELNNRNTLHINKIDFKESTGKRYLRLGVLPEKEESYNYLTGANEQGASVFELDLNGKPVLNNLQLVDSFSGRREMTAFIVTGEEVGTGQDCEPLLKNVEYIEKVSIDFTKITLETLKANFETIEGEYKETTGTMNVFHLNGLEVTFEGFTFSNAKENFETKMGAN